MQVLLESIKKGIDRANARAESNPFKIQKFTILPKEFSVASGELGPTLKLKRFFVDRKYAEFVEAMYAE
jgi:long-chain-fatty-acid--CoA ligase ACSBG